MRIDVCNPSVGRTKSALFLALAFLSLLVFTPTPSSAKNRTLTIVSEPGGAQVQFNGRYMGVTPLVLSYDNSFFNGHGRFAWSNYLNESVNMSVSKSGCLPQSRIITRGPFTWQSLDQTVAHTYYVFEYDRVNITLSCFPDHGASGVNGSGGNSAGAGGSSNADSERAEQEESDRQSKIQELQSEIESAQRQAQDDDARAAQMRQQATQAANQSNGYGAIAAGIATAGAAKFADDAQAERQKIADLTSQIQQLQQQNAAAARQAQIRQRQGQIGTLQAQAQAQVAAPAQASTPVVQPAAVPAQAPTPAAQPAAFTPVVPSDENGASLVDTMAFIQSELSVEPTIYFTITNRFSVRRIAEQYSRVVGDPQSCRLTYHERESDNSDGQAQNAPADADHELDLRSVQQLAMMSADEEYKNLPGNPPVPAFSPAVFVLQIKHSGTFMNPSGGVSEIKFLDSNLADGVARAMLHAVNLCTAK